MRTPRPPMREAPDQPGPQDLAIANYWMQRHWSPQDLLLLPRDRQIDENVRMVLGQQHLVWLPLLQRHFDVAEWFQEPDRRMRERVTVNRLLSWFVQTHARLSENQPILTFVPMADAGDAEQADVMDRLHKWHYRRAGGPSALARAQAWSVVAGAGYLLTYIDPTKGPWRPWTAAAVVDVIDPRTEEVINRVEHPEVPVDREGNAAVVMTPDGQLMPHPKIQPHQTRRGDIMFDVLSPLEVRGQFGPTPWYQKRWHGIRRYMTESDIWERFRVEVQQHGSPGGVPNDIIAQRVLYGSGHYAGGSVGFPGLIDQRTSPAGEPMHEVHYFWQAPDTDETQGGPNEPGGRYTVLLDQRQVITDGPRPIGYPFTSPIHEFPFFQVPGRNWPSSPQDPLNSPQRHLNKERTHVAMHTHLNAHPIAVLDRGSGLKRDQWTNEPGTAVTAVRRAAVPAIEFVGAPPLGEAVWRHGDMADRDIDQLGMLLGTSGEPISADQSGEAIRELRYNSDRYLGHAAREQSEEMSRFGRTLVAHYGVLYDQVDELIQVVGEDDAPMTLRVYPQMFDPEGVDVLSDVEAMMPESRQQRMQRIERWYEQGLFGQPGTPEAVRKYWEVGRFPHYARAASPGGVDAVTAKRFLGQLLRGTPAQALPVFPWYDNSAFLYTLEQQMKSHTFLRLDPNVQNNILAYHGMHSQAAAQKAMEQQQQEEQMMRRQLAIKREFEQDDDDKGPRDDERTE